METNEILDGLDIDTHEGWLEGMQRAIDYMAKTDEMAIAADKGPGEPLPVIVRDETTFEAITVRPPWHP